MLTVPQKHCRCCFVHKELMFRHARLSCLFLNRQEAQSADYTPRLCGAARLVLTSWPRDETC